MPHIYTSCWRIHPPPCLNITSAAHEHGMQGLRHVEVLTQALCPV